jgi:GNAT superfamily N-acetyltransferase
MRIAFELLTQGRVPALRALFEAASCPCFCRYWHFEGTKNEWLDRCAERRSENARELEDAARRGDPSARGIVAIRGDEIVGWMKIAPRRSLPKLARLPVYRGLPVGDDDTTFSVGCFLVDPRFRLQGVARGLLEEACRAAPAWGARVIEGYPRRSSEPMHPEETWQGPEALFIELGFVAEHAFAAYPIYRKVL